MHSFPYLYSPDKISLIFERLGEYKAVTKVTYRQLSALGFSSSKDRPILPFLILLGFLDQNGFPTQSYFYLKEPLMLKKYLNNKLTFIYKQILERTDYVSDVSVDILAGIFMDISGSMPGSCLIYAKTMKSLINYCDFKKSDDSFDKSNKSNTVISPNLNISINLPTTTDEAVYEKLFKHLKDFLSPQ